MRTISRAAALVAGVVGLGVGVGWGQTFVYPQPDCAVFFRFTGAAQVSKAVDNRTVGCSTWSMAYVNSGFSAVSVTLQSAANSAGSPSTYGTGFPVQQTVLTGSNPSTSTTGGFLWVQGTNAWVRVTLASSTGSGVVDGALYGWRIPSAGAVGGGGVGTDVTIVGPLGETTADASIPVVLASDQTPIQVGGGAAVGEAPTGNPIPVGYQNSAGNLVIPDYCTLKATFSTSSSGATQLVAVSSTTTIRVCHVDWSGDTLAIAKLVTGTGSTCTSPTDETGVFTGAGGGAFGFAMDYASPLATTAAKTLCINLSAGSTGGGTIIYSQR